MPKTNNLLRTGWAIAIAICHAQAFAADSALPNIDDLMRKFIHRSLEEDDLRLDEKYGYIERRITDKLDKDGDVQEHRDETFQVILLGGHPVQRLILKEGKPLSANDQGNETDRDQRLLDGQWKREAESLKKQRNSDRLTLDEKFMSHFQFDLVGSEEINHRLSYIISMHPKKSAIPVRNNREQVFTHMQGKVWVDANDYSLARFDLHLTETTTFYIILGCVRRLDVLVQRRFIDTKVWMPEEIFVYMDSRELLSNTRVRKDSVYSDFRKLAD